MTGRRQWTTWLVAAGLLVAGCGGSDDVESEASPQPTAQPPAVASETAPSTPAPEPSEDAGDRAGGRRTYTVRSGDTLSAIARQFDTTIEALARANDIADPNVIDIGQELVIPRR